MAVERKKGEGQPSGEPPKSQKKEPAKGRTKPAARSKEQTGDAPRPKRAETGAPAGKGEGRAPRRRQKEPAEEKSAPAASTGRKRGTTARRAAPAEQPPVAAPVVRARAKYLRSSARKARLVITHIRGKSVEEARGVLRHTPRGIARDVEKLLESAVANAENNHDLVGDDLMVKEAYADEGPTLKRWRPRARGRAGRIRKRTSHLTLTLTPRE